MKSGRTAAITTRQHRITRQCASLLLAYPDDHFHDRIRLVQRAIVELPASSYEPLHAAASELVDLPLTAAAEQYVDTFDLRRSRSLFLTYWTHGDTRNRGAAMLDFATAYRTAGAESPPDELPDHLAVVLEFAAIVNAQTGTGLLRRYRPAIQLLRNALADFSSPYTSVLEAVLQTIPEATPGETARAAAELATQGPPAELVGLAPYSVIVPVDRLTTSLRMARGSR